MYKKMDPEARRALRIACGAKRWENSRLPADTPCTRIAIAEADAAAVREIARMRRCKVIDVLADAVACLQQAEKSGSELKEPQIVSMAEARAAMKGKRAEIYIARHGAVTVIRCDGNDYMVHNIIGGAWVKNPLESYWRNSISWRGTRADFLLAGVVPPPTPDDWSIPRIGDERHSMAGLYD